MPAASSGSRAGNAPRQDDRRPLLVFAHAQAGNPGCFLKAKAPEEIEARLVVGPDRSANPGNACQAQVIEETLNQPGAQPSAARTGSDVDMQVSTPF